MTMDTTGKVSSGQPFRPPPAPIWNAMVDAGNAFKNNQLGTQQAPKLIPRKSDIVKVRNDTGADRVKGQVIGLGDKITTNVEQKHTWFEGVAPTAGVKYASVAIYLGAVVDGNIGDAQVAGVCIARVNVSSTVHTHAYVVPGSYVLASSFVGPFELVSEPASTGEAEYYVIMRRDRSVAIFQSPGGGIPARSGTTAGSANCKAFYINDSNTLVEIKDSANTSLAVPVKNIFGGAIGGDAYITAKEHRGKLIADAEDCG